MRKIIIVDSDSITIDNLVHFLEEENYEVVSASSGDEALEYIRRQAFDLGIIDIRLSGANGNTVMLQAHQLQPDLQFIVYSADNEYVPPQAVLAQGNLRQENVLYKSLATLKELLEHVKGVVE